MPSKWESSAALQTTDRIPEPDIRRVLQYPVLREQTKVTAIITQLLEDKRVLREALELVKGHTYTWSLPDPAWTAVYEALEATQP